MSFFIKRLLVIIIFACLLAQISATKRKGEEISEVLAKKAKKPLPFDLNKPAPTELKNEKKSSEFYKARYRREKERMENDPSYLQRLRERQAKFRVRRSIKLTEKELKQHNEDRKKKNRESYLRRKAIHGVYAIKQRRVIAEIKQRMNLGPISETDRNKIEDYYTRKRKSDREYGARKKEKRKIVQEMGNNTTQDVIPQPSPRLSSP